MLVGFKCAAEKGHLEVIKVLLNDRRVDPMCIAMLPTDSNMDCSIFDMIRSNNCALASLIHTALALMSAISTTGHSVFKDSLERHFLELLPSAGLDKLPEAFINPFLYNTNNNWATTKLTKVEMIGQGVSLQICQFLIL